MPGLEPGIQGRQTQGQVALDCRVKPGNDAFGGDEGGRQCAPCKSRNQARDFELVERPMPEPGPSQVSIKVEACGICHSDSFTVLGHLVPIKLPARARA